MPNPPKLFPKYNLLWPAVYDPASLEIEMIKRGGQWKMKNGGTAGHGLFYHYKALQTLLWPEDSHNRWSDLMLKTILAKRIIPIQGPKDSGKTHSALAKYGLTDYFCFPDNTLVIISSTELRGLEYRVWGDLKNLFQRARERFDWLPGHMLDSKHAICTESLTEEEFSNKDPTAAKRGRDMRKGIVCIPCMSAGGSWVGLGKYVGMKQERRRLLADEVPLMKDGFLESVSNMNSRDFKGVFCGNPIGIGDPMDRIAEPKNGWGTEGDVSKTTTWENKWIDGLTIQLVGTDSPNFDQSQDPEPKYPWLINQKSIENTIAFFGMDSPNYFKDCLGVRNASLDQWRVITDKMCRQFGAYDQALWMNTKRTHIYGLDAAYGSIGGDRCIGLHLEFGEGADGRMIMLPHQPTLIPVSVKESRLPEDQIADFVKADCERLGIPPENVYYDATGRGSLGTSFARIWSAYVNPVEFGGSPSNRPVTADFWILDKDTGKKRLKTCAEHYSKFVTELWYATRLIIESRQMREMPKCLVDEGKRRNWQFVRGDKTEIESKKDMKERCGYSPDQYDAFVTAVEGARRQGFLIHKFQATDAPVVLDDWKKKLLQRRDSIRSRGQLIYT